MEKGVFVGLAYNHVPDLNRIDSMNDYSKLLLLFVIDLTRKPEHCSSGAQLMCTG
jgi:hypothetical protein